MSVKKHIKAQEKGGVLVLNQAYQPVGTTPLSRALLKLNLDPSPFTVEEYSRNPDGSIKFVTTAGGEKQGKPSVVRMKEWESKIPFRKSTSLRTFVYQRDKFTCQYCAQQFGVKELTLDHIFPKSKGGDNEATNLVTACKTCNGRKADRTPEEARMPLINPLTIYRVSGHRIQLCQYAEGRPEWRAYLFLDDDISQTGTNG